MFLNAMIQNEKGTSGIPLIRGQMNRGTWVRELGGRGNWRFDARRGCGHTFKNSMCDTINKGYGEDYGECM